MFTDGRSDGRQAHRYILRTFRSGDKKPQFQKIRKLQNLIHFDEKGISCIEIFLSQTSILLQNAAKGWNSLGHWRSILWPLNWAYITVMSMGKIFAP